MQTVTVGTKFQIVIPKEVRKKIKGLEPGTKVNISTYDNKTISVEPNLKSWVERTYGMMKDAWKDIDPVAEIEKSRDEWEEKVKEIEKGLKRT